MVNFDEPYSVNTDAEQPAPMNFLRRFIYDSWNNVLKEVERQTTGPLMVPLMSPRERQPRMLSNIAKMNEQGYPENRYKETLPPVDIAAIMIQQAQFQSVQGSAPANAFPYKLAAVGRVNGLQIFLRSGQPGEMVSSTAKMQP